MHFLVTMKCTLNYRITHTFNVSTLTQILIFTSCVQVVQVELLDKYQSRKPFVLGKLIHGVNL